MAMTLKEWLNSECFTRFKDISQIEFFEREFMRNPIRRIDINNNICKSPADGVLLYTGLYDANSSVIEIKGRRYTVKDILMNPKKEGRFYVAGIFLTSYSVHVVRAVASGIITKIMQLPPLISSNMSMTLFEQGIYSGKFLPDYLDYNFYNERTIVKQYVPAWNTYVYYVLVADLEVNCNLLYVKKGEPIVQGERLAFVTFGSQVDILIAKKPWLRVKRLIDELMYVFAGEDDLFRIYNKYWNYQEYQF